MPASAHGMGGDVPLPTVTHAEATTYDCSCTETCTNARAHTHTRDILRLCQAAEWSAAEKPLRELRVLEVLGVRCGAVRGSSRVCLRRPDRMQQEDRQHTGAASCWQSGRGAAHTHTYTHMARACLPSSVRVTHGATELTRMRCGAHSTARLAAS